MASTNDDLHPYIHEIWGQTQNDPSTLAERSFVDGFFENWVGELIHVYGDQLLEADKLDNSLFFSYISAQATNFHWYGHTLYCGAYTILFREFRCILEGMFMVYKIESLHPEKSMDEKLAILAEGENQQGSFGKGLFRSSTYDDWEQYYQVYRNLSSYIHFSYSKTAHIIQKIKTDGFPDAVDYSYDKQKFLEATAVWKDMANLAVDMVNSLSEKNNLDFRFSKDLFEH